MKLEAVVIAFIAARLMTSWLSFSEQILSNKFPKDKVPFEVPVKPNYVAAKLLYPNRTPGGSAQQIQKIKDDDQNKPKCLVGFSSRVMVS